jgi:virulence factor Mce-like protein
MKKREIKIGIFVVTAAVILGSFIFVVGDLSRLFTEPGYPIFLYFDSAAGLEKGTVVRMAGVKIGYVKDIRLKDQQAEVELSIRPEVKLPVDSKATLASLGILGEKYIEIIPGPTLKYAMEGSSLEVASPLSLEKLGTELVDISSEIQETGETLRDVIGDEKAREDFRRALEDLAAFASDLREISSRNKELLTQGLQETRETVQSFDREVADISQSMDELIAAYKRLVDENRDDIRNNLDSISGLVNNAEQSLAKLDEAIEKINRGEGTLGKLIGQPELYQRAEETMGKIQDVMRPVTAFRASVGLQFEYFVQPNFLKSYLSFYLWPTGDRYLMAQIIQDPWRDEFTYSAQAGIRWGNFSPRAGVMQSKIGAGLDVYAWKDRLKFSLEAFNFNRRPQPHFRFYSGFSLSKHVYVIAGIEDFALKSRRELFFGLGLGI